MGEKKENFPQYKKKKKRHFCKLDKREWGNEVQSYSTGNHNITKNSFKNDFGLTYNTTFTCVQSKFCIHLQGIYRD